MKSVLFVLQHGCPIISYVSLSLQYVECTILSRLTKVILLALEHSESVDVLPVPYRASAQSIGDKYSSSVELILLKYQAFLQ